MSSCIQNSALTPHYVLLMGNQRIGPIINASIDSDKHLVVYGFSDKAPYDQFLSNFPTLLTPYPLVQRYLSDKVKSADLDLRLVVIDATGPEQDQIGAVTMESALSALHDNCESIAITHCLTFDATTAAYNISPCHSD